MNNRHLSLFRFYSESSNEEFRENNLTRALAISLREEPMLLILFLRIIERNADEFENLLQSGEKVLVEIQKRCSSIEASEKIIAVTLTPEVINNEFLEPEEGFDEPITDLYIKIGNVTIIVEIKTIQIDCRRQLSRQVQAISETLNFKIPVFFRPISWTKVINMFLCAKRLQTEFERPSPFVEGFIQLMETGYPHWFPVISLKNIPFPNSENIDNLNFLRINERLELIKSRIGPIVAYRGRTAIEIDVLWASEANLVIDKNSKSICLAIWPGDSKGQGYSLFNRSLSWINIAEILAEGKSYSITIKPYIKLSHYNGGISWITTHSVQEKELFIRNVHTKDNFYNKSGRWKREDWYELDNFLSLGLNGIDWKERATWNDSFINTNRNYVDVSFGFEVKVLIPYIEAQKLDVDIEDGVNELSVLLKKILGTMVSTINS